MSHGVPSGGITIRTEKPVEVRDDGVVRFVHLHMEHKLPFADRRGDGKQAHIVPVDPAPGVFRPEADPEIRADHIADGGRAVALEHNIRRKTGGGTESVADPPQLPGTDQTDKSLVCGVGQVDRAMVGKGMTVRYG